MLNPMWFKGILDIKGHSNLYIFITTNNLYKFSENII